MSHTARRPRDRGFTLVEILLAVVVVGILSAVVVVGVGSLLDRGAGSACAASADAARTASRVVWTTTGTRATSFADLVDAGALEPPDTAAVDDTGYLLIAEHWALRFDEGGAGPTFTCTTPEPPDGFTTGPRGHYFRFVPGTITWADAVTESASHRAGDERGYLATITSEAEHDFVRSLFGDLQSVWLGGTDADVEGTWRWATGPEAGTVFSSGPTATPGSYVNWARNEPNDDGNQDCLHLWRGGGHLWDDVSCTNGRSAGYIVEIGG